MSRALSWILRHGAVKLGLDMDEEGYVKIEDILKHKKNLTEEDVFKICEKDKKNRFSIKEKSYIRANQGHSQEVSKCLDFDKIYERIEKPEPCIHCTFEENVESIKEKGLMIMNRSHIHFCTPDNLKLMGRNNSTTQIMCDMEKAMKDGIIFYRSKNGVILTSGIDGILDSQYLKF